jgi:superfamily II DNA or RNA helicase
MGATQKRAIDRLVNLGAEVRISYDGTTTRLHAKSWLMRRNSGATTAYIGSSNLSKAALSDGIEWNVRVSAREQEHVINAIASTFENYWNDSEFQKYDPDIDGDRLIASLKIAKTSSSDSISVSFANIEVTPRPYQQEVLDQLKSERFIHDRWRNLVVMATGTGKTVVAGLDYKQLFEIGEVNTLLFVAHRQEILDQSLVTFRTIMRDGTFGEKFVGGERPVSWRHVFGSIQSLNNLDFETLRPDAFDMIIIDEFHHAAASSYASLLEYFTPKVLVGLTATPERSDGQSLLQWFENGISAELRLWEAIDRQILSPFQYFGIHDNVDLEASGITWRRGFGYDVNELSKIYTGNDARVSIILQQMNKYIDDLSEMKAIGFCVSIEHAEYMAIKFAEAGIPAKSVTSRNNDDERKKALSDLRKGDLKIVFAVDIFNEGVDLPDINTLLMLRPTESSTIFIQQLGRGLRKSTNKSCLTVLDFIGNQNKNFRFDLKYGGLFGKGRKQIADAVENEFPYLPSGCHFELDRISQEQILTNLRSSLRFDKKYFVNEIRTLGVTTVDEYFDSSGAELKDFYRNDRSFTLLKRLAFEPSSLENTNDVRFSKAIGRSLHIDDLERINRYSEMINGSPISVDDPYSLMLGYLLFNADVNKQNLLEKLKTAGDSEVFYEFAKVLELLKNQRSRLTAGRGIASVPLEVHATYTRAEILAGFGMQLTGAENSGVTYVAHHNADLAFVTLNKTESHFSPTTMYADTAISSFIFQWESQNPTSETSAVGKRYINHRKLGSTFNLFVRDFKTDPESGATMPYVYLGTANYISHTGNRPMRIRWHLDYEIPADIFVKSKVIAS